MRDDLVCGSSQILLSGEGDKFGSDEKFGSFDEVLTAPIPPMD